LFDREWALDRRQGRLGGRDHHGFIGRRRHAQVIWNLDAFTLGMRQHAQSARDIRLYIEHRIGIGGLRQGGGHQMEADVAKLQAAGLWATMAKDS